MTTYAKVAVSVAVLALNIACTHAAMAGARTNEINQRLANQEKHVTAGVNDGQISATKAAADEARITKNAAILNAAQEAGGGHISKAQDAQLNRKMNTNEAYIYNQRHY